MSHRGKIFIISAPSGAGKTSLVNALIQEHGNELSLYRVVTYTTKQPRAGEVEGVDYHYLSVELFEQKQEEGFFLEVTYGLGHYYGTPRGIIQECFRGRSPLLVIDREGARSIVTQHPSAVCIWVQVPSMELLAQRLYARGADSEEQIARRLARAGQEIHDEQKTQFYSYHIMNDDFQKALEKLTSIIKKELGLGDMKEIHSKNAEK